MRRTFALVFALACPLTACQKVSPPSGEAAPLGHAAARTSGHAEGEQLASLTVAEVAARRTDPGFFIFDNNSPATYKQGHLPGARWVDPADVKASDLPPDHDATLVFYCANEH